MNIQFVYVQKKDNAILDNEYLVIIKYSRDEEYTSLELNKIIYSELFKVHNVQDIQDINYMQKMYLKKGMILYDANISNTNNKEQSEPRREDLSIWNRFIKLKLNHMKLINLIDNKMTNKILNTDIIYFNYNKHKEYITSIISDIILSNHNLSNHN